MTSEQLGNALAPINALLNSTSTALLLVGDVAIKRRKIPVHRASMVGAFVASCVFGAVWGAIGGLAILNVVIAVFWS